MKVRFDFLEPGDIIYSFGDYHIVKSVSLIHHTIHTFNLRTRRDSYVTKTIVEFVTRQLSLF